MSGSYPLLETIQAPSDLKELSQVELLELCHQIRRRIINVTATTGGHLASSLGAVEMTVALHRAFNAPVDKFIFDVGHQTYPHKLLTGRNDRFPTLRKYKGLCGFTHPKESPYDHFHAGHAGNALSLGLGLAAARDQQGGDEYIVPVIGDASLTCGLTLEALNNIRPDLNKFLLVLNDNAMSISHNVGAITNILSRLLNSPGSMKLTKELQNLVSKIPACGTTLAKQGHKIAEAIRNLVRPAPFFDEYGLSYIGPIDGHDLIGLIDILDSVKDLKGPVILHLMTVKGQGMPEAMKNPITYHGARPFSLETGKFLPTTSSNPTFPKVFGKQMVAMAKQDPSLIAVTPAMSCGSCLDPLAEAFPKQCIDVGIAEGHCVTFSAGLAYSKKVKVVCSIYSTFLQRALDNLFHDVCLQEIPVVFAIDRAGISGPDGSTHHGIFDISFLKSMPGMILTQPRNGQVLVELLNSAFSWQRPVAIRYPNMETQEALLPLKNRIPGQAEVLSEGVDILILGLGHMAYTALEVKKILKEQGFNPTVVDPVFVKPLDKVLLRKLCETHPKIVTIEEHSLAAGFGSCINDFLQQEGLHHIQCLNFGIPDLFVGYGGYGDLIKELGLSAPQIAQKILMQLGAHKMISLTYA